MKKRRPYNTMLKKFKAKQLETKQPINMPGKITTLGDLGAAVRKLQAEVKKELLISEFRRAFEKEGKPPSICHALAEAKYKKLYGTR